MKIVITGGSGLLATELIKQLYNTEHAVFVLTSNKESLKLFWGDKIVINTITDWQSGIFSFKDKDLVINCSFARSHKGGEEIAKALMFTKNLIDDLKDKCVPALINISTQEVYGKVSAPWIEGMRVEPNTIYGTAKYFTELLTNEFGCLEQFYSTNIRLAGLLSEKTNSRLVNRFVEQVLNEDPIKIVGGELTFSHLDVRDAAAGIISLLAVSSKKWYSEYNLGYEKSYTIDEIVKDVCDVSSLYNKKVEVIKEESSVYINAVLDSSRLYNQTNWLPKFNMYDIVKTIFEFKLKINNERDKQ